MSILVLTPTREETEAFCEALARRGYAHEIERLERLPVTRFPALGITAAHGGTGKAQFAVHTQHLLDVLPALEVVVCAGAAGALAEHVSVGDVVVATETVEHDYDNRFNDRPLPAFPGAPHIIARLRAKVGQPGPFAVHFGPVASGDEDIVTDGRRQALHHRTNALAVAWEGAGGARACAFSQVPYVEIRAATDAANEHAPSDFEANLALAMDNLATVVVDWLAVPDGRILAP